MVRTSRKWSYWVITTVREFAPKARHGAGDPAAQGGPRTISKVNEIMVVLRACRSYFLTAAAFSLAINLLYLAAPLYMMQIYDRVISSGSRLTLVMLSVVLLMAFAALSGLDTVRARVLTRASMRLDQLLAARVVAASVDASLQGGASWNKPLRDFDTVRQFLTGSGIHAVFDLPWTPIYIAIIFCLHPVLGVFAFLSAVSLIAMALANEFWTRGVLSDANEAAGWNYNFTDMSLRNAQVIQAMGMMPGLLRRWTKDRHQVLERQQVASDRAAIMSAVIRFLRLSMQSIILGIGAYLVIDRLATGGAMFAAPLLLGRALQPVEQIVGSWRNLVSAQTSYHRLRSMLETFPLRPRALSLPKPTGRLSVEGLGSIVPGNPRPILHGVSFRVEPGETVCVIGPSGAGKSTLARHIVGVLPPAAGAVRLDGADVFHGSREAIGRYIGYLPQDIELFADTVAANISRFNEDEDALILKASQMAGVHEMILRLPNGYETYLGEGGAVLSGGLRQRLALARAVYADPSLVVLDEPSSNLDSDGDVALAECVRRLKEQGTTVVIISHRPATIGLVDKILVIRNGTSGLFGPRDEVLRRLTRGVPMHVVAGGAAS